MLTLLSVSQQEDDERCNSETVGMTKSCSLPVHMTHFAVSKKSECQSSTAGTDVRESGQNCGNDSDSKHSPHDANGNEERKKKSAFSKLLNKSKQKSA